MESKNDLDILVDIPNYSGPLQTLLDLAKNQKVDLTQISVTVLADHFLDYIKKAENLDLAFEYLIMATWLAYLKSKLLLPEDEEDEFKASDIAEKLKLQLKKLELIRLLSDQMLKRKRLGVDTFMRGIKGGVRSIYSIKYSINLYEILKTYSTIIMKKDFQKINIPKLPVLTSEEGIKQIRSLLNLLVDWKEIKELIPKEFKSNNKYKKTGLAGILAASLELVKEGNLMLKQEKIFDKIYAKQKIN